MVIQLRWLPTIWASEISSFGPERLRVQRAGWTNVTWKEIESEMPVPLLSEYLILYTLRDRILCSFHVLSVAYQLVTELNLEIRSLTMRWIWESSRVQTPDIVAAARNTREGFHLWHQCCDTTKVHELEPALTDGQALGNDKGDEWMRMGDSNVGHLVTITRTVESGGFGPNHGQPRHRKQGLTR